MKILIIHNILWAHYKSALFEQIEKAAGKEDEVLVLQIAKNELSRKNMETTEFPYSYNFKVLFDDYIDNLSTFKKFKALASFILKFKPDLVNATGYAADISITFIILFCRLLGIKVVISNESTALESNNNFIKETIKKILVKSSSGFICFGKLAKDYMIQLGAKPYQIIEDKAAVVDDIRILESFEEAKRNNFAVSDIKTSKNFIFVGRIIEEKNLGSLFNSFDSFKRKNIQFDDWGLIILGDGELKAGFQKYVADKHISDVYFLPSVSWEEVPKYFTLADVFVLPSKSETWGLVVNEAMICGLPIIISDKCGCSSDLLKNNGLIFQSGDENTLEAHFKKMASDADFREKCGLNSLEVISEFKVENVGARVLNGFKNL
jgi:glycosyltransferase involved in cell wall biosynthesis